VTSQQTGPTEVAPATRQSIETEFAELEHLEEFTELAPDRRLAYPGRPCVFLRLVVVAEQDES
jgi:hypothetical protein